MASETVQKILQAAHAGLPSKGDFTHHITLNERGIATLTPLQQDILRNIGDDSELTDVHIAANSRINYAGDNIINQFIALMQYDLEICEELLVVARDMQLGDYPELIEKIEHEMKYGNSNISPVLIHASSLPNVQLEEDVKAETLLPDAIAAMGRIADHAKAIADLKYSEAAHDSETGRINARTLLGEIGELVAPQRIDLSSAITGLHTRLERHLQTYYGETISPVDPPHPSGDQSAHAMLSLAYDFATQAQELNTALQTLLPDAPSRGIQR
ncbi:MAG: hypothetical protein CMM94_00010 [Rickettsiales bacterium]|nr:hypothetical protein [Rickettsiales bacterium]